MRVIDQLVYFARLHGVVADAAHTAAEYWLRRLDLTAYREDRPATLRLDVMQRVRLAAALVHEPTVILLDEPFPWFDPVLIDALGEQLREHANAGTAVIIASRNPALIEQLCDRVTIISRGQVSAEATVDQLTPCSATLTKLFHELASERAGS